MAVHVCELNIQEFRGINDLTIHELNHINILTGMNNSGKTSLMEVISTIDNPEDTGTWVSITRMRGPFSSYYDGFYNLFPIDRDEKSVAYSYKLSNGTKTTTKVKADIEHTQIPESEKNRINGLIRTGSTKRPENIIDAKNMIINVSVNGNSIKDIGTVYSEFFVNNCLRLLTN